MRSQTKENYLKAMFALDQRAGKISITDLSKSLDLSTPTVNNMIKKLKTMGWVNYEKYQPITFTEQGRREAALVLRKHRLTEMFLVEKMGFGWENVHAIAEQIEHVESQEFFDRMDELLGYPKYDPHGSPIPDKEGNITFRNLKRLSECQEDQTVVIKRLAHESKAFLEYLNGKKLRIGSELTIMELEDFDGSLIVNFNQKTLTLSEKVCDQLFVEIVK
ncbi:MAG: metal-dependent transcriptional regulator [Flavobacteriales bacterium]|nr:metal-dependent transcriptional regulator [Flavobacteriales bacterium]